MDFSIPKYLNFWITQSLHLINYFLESNLIKIMMITINVMIGSNECVKDSIKLSFRINLLIKKIKIDANKYPYNI